MAKPKAPASQPSEEPKQEDFSTAHPLMRHGNQTTDMLEKAMVRKDFDDFQIKEKEQWRIIVNSIASTQNGKLLFKSMIDYAGVLAPPPINNPAKMVTNSLKGAFYFTWIRPYLNPEVRKELD